MGKSEGQWLKFADFAREIGCTPANIYRYVKNHPEKLEPEVIKEGRFMVISPAGQDYIRSLMHPKTMSESAVAQQISYLQAMLSKTDHEAAAMARELADVRGKYNEVARLLAIAEKTQAEKDAELEAEKAAHRADNEAAAAAKEKADQAAQEAAERAQRDQETIRELEKKLAEEDAARAEAVARADALARRGLIDRILNRGV